MSNDYSEPDGDDVLDQVNDWMGAFEGSRKKHRLPRTGHRLVRD